MRSLQKKKGSDSYQVCEITVVHMAQTSIRILQNGSQILITTTMANL